jgi:chemotaxis protein MotB
LREELFLCWKHDVAKKQKHEDHTNHEAWAIPYGDMVTLLLAFFVVMYSISSVNEGKYRVLSDALSHAFGGPPKSVKPVQIGTHRQSGADSDRRINIFERDTVEQAAAGDARNLRNPVVLPSPNKIQLGTLPGGPAAGAGDSTQRANLQRMADAVQKAMGPLIDRNMIIVRKSELKLEVEIRTDILFASGSAQIDTRALPVLARLAGILQPFPNALRIEGHTDNVPIHTGLFSSNWELSAARAASVVHLFMEQGVEPRRMSVEGFGEYRPAADNSGADGRNRNRRVVLVVLAGDGQTVPVSAAGAPAAPAAAAAAPDTPAAPAAAPAEAAAVPDAAAAPPQADAVPAPGQPPQVAAGAAP